VLDSLWTEEDAEGLSKIASWVVPVLGILTLFGVSFEVTTIGRI